MPLANGDDCRVAVLAVGLAGPGLEAHMRAASQAMLQHGAAVFAVGEAQEAAALAAFPAVLGPSLRALGLVSQHAVQRPTYLPQSVDFAAIKRPPPPLASVRPALQGDGGRWLCRRRWKMVVQKSIWTQMLLLIHLTYHMMQIYQNISMKMN